MRTQVAIIGAGPAGLLLGQLLHRHGIENIVLERQYMAYVLGRIRAGVLEQGTVNLLSAAGVDARMNREGYMHGGVNLSHNNKMFHVNFKELVGKSVMVYGQTEITRDLFDARIASGAPIFHGVKDVDLCDFDTDKPVVTFKLDGITKRISCDFIAGCDGFHGVSRRAMPAGVLREFEKIYPFGWLGVLSETRPASDELIYANSRRGFALASMRNAHLSRYYLQVPLTDTPEQWSDTAFWDELRRRLPENIADQMETGPSIEKSIAPLRSYVAEPMRSGRLFLCGDAAHIVPPTGAKGLNLAASDVSYLFNGLRDHYIDNDDTALDAYSKTALSRVWNAVRFSWSMTNLMHRIPEDGAFGGRVQTSELNYLRHSEAAQTAFAENYVGLPY